MEATVHPQRPDTVPLREVSNWCVLAEQARFHAPTLAAIIGVSNRRLERFFHVHTSHPPRDWLHKLRMRTAVKRLVTGIPIQELSRQLGYHDRSHFHRHFQQFFNTTPARFLSTWKQCEAQWTHRGGQRSPATELTDALASLESQLHSELKQSRKPPNCTYRVALLAKDEGFTRIVQEAVELLAPRWQLDAYLPSGKAIALLAVDPPTVILFSSTVHTTPNITILETLTTRLPCVPVIVLGAEAPSDGVISALGLGAHSYLPYTSHPSEIVQAIKNASISKPYLHPMVHATLLRVVSRAFKAGIRLGLTRRECEVALLLLGATEKDVAQELTLSVNTVHTITSTVYRKLGIHDRRQLIGAFLPHRYYHTCR